MKKRLNVLFSLLTACALLSACSSQDMTESTAAPESTEEAVTASPESDNIPVADSDPYAIENRYDVPQDMFEKHNGVDYGTLLKDVTYYSTVAEDNKQVNILLPAGYDETQSYPTSLPIKTAKQTRNFVISTIRPSKKLLST